MIGYATIGTNDLERATKFYDAVLAPLGGQRTFANGERMQFYGSKDTPGMIAVSKPYDEKPATVGNGTMSVCRRPPRNRSMRPTPPPSPPAASATAPGQRLPTFYGAYFRDPDGNKVCVFKMG